MAGKGSAPGERRGGRKKGTPNKATADIKAALRMHGDEFVEALIELTKSDDERVRLGALQTAFDRGFGKAVQHIETELSVYDSLGLEEQQALLAALEMLDAPAVTVTDPPDPLELPGADSRDRSDFFSPARALRASARIKL